MICEILDAALDHTATFHDIHGELHKFLLHDTWRNSQARCWMFLTDLKPFIARLESLLSIM